jgi:high-affinity iron transporter
MLVPFLIMLREGIEAALVVAIVATHLSRTGRGDAMWLVWTGVAIASALCVVVGAGLAYTASELPQRLQELFEAGVGFFAVVVLTWMVFWMRRAARSIKAELHDGIDRALGEGGSKFALVALAFFAVAREGLESVLFLIAAFEQSGDVGLGAPTGAVLGLIVAIGLGVGLYKGGLKLNLAQFFRFTGIFILFVAAGLLAGSLRSLHEAGIWNSLQAVAFDASGWLPEDTPLGMLLSGIFGYHDAPTVGEVGIYLLYIALALTAFLLQPAPRRVNVKAA